MFIKTYIYFIFTLIFVTWISRREMMAIYRFSAFSLLLVFVMSVMFGSILGAPPAGGRRHRDLQRIVHLRDRLDRVHLMQKTDRLRIDELHKLLEQMQQQMLQQEQQRTVKSYHGNSIDAHDDLHQEVAKLR